MNRSQRLLAVCFVLIADATASNARAGVTIDASECKRQVDAWLNPNIDCTIHIHFDAFADPSVKGILLLVVNGSSRGIG